MFRNRVQNSVRARRNIGVFGVLLLGAVLTMMSCAVLTPLPEPTTLEDRISVFPTDAVPVERPVSLRWNTNQVPYIEAETDADAAFVLGMVHAHLRLGQLAVVRRIIQGRISESASIFTVDLDAAIRAFDFYQATDEIYRDLPSNSKLWMDRYVAGINHYAARLPDAWRPHEFDVAGINWEPWTAQDSLALGRAAGVDLNWIYLLQMLQIEDPETRSRVAARLLESGQTGTITYGEDIAERTVPDGFKQFASFAARHGRSGSNSIVVAPSRSSSNAAIIANDPHLAFLFPNPWVIAGLRSPSYRIVGMMVPGTPVFGFGRNETLAWGGTNLRATTSQFVNVADLPETAFETRSLKIGTRYWFDQSVEVRTTRYGPILSDLSAAPETGSSFSVRWTGHTPTDETTALLDTMKARTVAEFRDAMAGFSFPPQTFLAADTEGSVAGIIAAKVPGRDPDGGYPILTSPDQSDKDWGSFYSGKDLPAVIDPESGFLVSANNRPAPSPEKPYGGVFPQDERVRRLRDLVGEHDKLSVSDLTDIQQDVVSPLSLELVNALEDDLLSQRVERRLAGVVDLILSWDGAYAANSQAALVFEAFLARLAPDVYATLGKTREYEAYQALGRTRVFLVEDYNTLLPIQRREVLKRALEGAREVQRSGKSWGDIHRMRVAHVLGNVPILGGRYLIEDIPASGSRETVMKSDHPLTTERHDTFFGSQSRHISDLSDPDSNFFLLLGGQDGWINSDTFSDQVALWKRGEFVKMPLRMQSVQKQFPILQVLTAD